MPGYVPGWHEQDRLRTPTRINLPQKPGLINPEPFPFQNYVDRAGSCDIVCLHTKNEARYEPSLSEMTARLFW
jgi:hypothetical protein